MSGEVLLLRIKKCWLDKIRSGVKRVEYRKDSTYYGRVFSDRKRYSFLQFHYQNPNDKPIFKIKHIRKVKRPKQFEGSDMLPTPIVWAIYLDLD